ncbi:MAG: PKD domain-containing protein, partial [Bacteroidota bacterium]|nr:PKD domain-containing protein [Bacteroidota bacterium]
FNENYFQFFNNSSIINNDSIYNIWDLGDNTIDTSKTYAHTYSNFDTFNVKLTTYSEFGCKDSMEKTVYVRPNPQTNFYINDSTQCLYNNLFVFSDSSNIAYGTINYLWDYGNNNGTNSQNPVHTYSSDDTFHVKLVTTSNYACKDSISKSVIVFPMPNAGFSINDSNQCLSGNNFSFTNLSTINSGNQYFSWDFGDNDTSTSQNPSHSYLSYDTFLIKLKVVSDFNCSDSINKNIYVNPHPVSDFSIDDSVQCFNYNNFNFTNQSNIPYGSMTHFWNFENNQSSNSTNPSVSYTVPDTFSIKLTSTSNEGCKDSISKAVYVFPTPNLLFSFNDSDQCLSGNYFQISNSSNIQSGLQTYLWNFGDNDTSTQINTSHSYSYDDTFTVMLIANSNLNCSDTQSKKVIVFPMPVATFSIDDSSQCLRGNEFTFINHSSITSASLTYKWDFDDGQSDTAKNINHIFANHDTFTVQLMATSSFACQDSISKAIYVHPMPVADYFIWDTSQCFERNAFGFSNMSSIPYGTMSYNWFFGDDSTSTETAPVHSYTYADTFEVKLITTSGHGCKDSTWGVMYIHVHPEPVADFLINDSAQCLSNNFFNLTNTSSISSGSFTQTWYFGDGNVDSVFNSSHSFLDYDTLNVRLLIVSDWACKDSIEKTVIIHPMPVPDFIIDTASHCLNSNIFNFTDKSSIPYGNYNPLWYFGDSDTSTQQNPSHSYLYSDTFIVKLLATSDNNCKDSILKNIFIRPMPSASFLINNNDQCFTNNIFSFTNKSNISSGNLNYLWDYGDSIFSNDTNPDYSYQYFDTFFVKLISTSGFNCVDSLIKQVFVRPMPTTDFNINDSLQCLLNNYFEFNDNSTIPYGHFSNTWDFGDGNLDTNKNTFHLYQKHDTLRVQLLITSNYACKDSLTKKVYVRPMPIADFEIDDSSQCFEFNFFKFSNKSTIAYDFLNYSWNFGDLNTSIFPNPNHSYLNYDTFLVRLIATSDYNCRDTFEKSLWVHPMPLADFGINDTDQCFRNNEFKFANQSSIPYGSVGYLWNFGDSNFATTENALHSYKYDSLFTIKLLITSGQDCKDSLEKQIFVRPMPETKFTINDNTQCLSGNNFIFTNSSSIKYGLLFYKWNFGNGDTSININPSVIYNHDSSYRVLLISTSNNYNCIDSIEKNVIVYPMPEVHFSYERPCLVDTTEFTDLSTINQPDVNTQWIWDFGNGNFATSQNPWHIYTISGLYDVKLKVISNNNCADSLTKQLKFFEQVNAPILDRVSVEDESILIEFKTVSLGNPMAYVIEKSTDSLNFSQLIRFGLTDFDFIDKQVDVSSQSYIYRIKTIDSCYFHSSYSNIGKSILLQINENKEYPELVWNKYMDWQAGISGYNIFTWNEKFQSFGLLSAENSTSYIDTRTNFNQEKYCYYVEAIRNVDGKISKSNTACVETPCNLYIPNSFTPNGDGLNDEFIVKGTYILDFQMQIYNRWGELVFETNDYKKGWDGKYKGSNCPVGVYFVQVFAKGTNSQKENFSTTVNLIR